MGCNEKGLVNYRHSLSQFCYYVGLCQRSADKVRDGRMEQDELIKNLSLLSSWKNYLLEDKEAAGIDGGLSFMEDNSFMGFKIKDGRFEGDRSAVLPVITKWLEGFPESANSYQFEVSMLVLNLAFDVSDNVFDTAAFAA